MRRSWILGLIVLAIAALGAFVARIVVFPRPLSIEVASTIVRLRARIALAGLVMGAGFGVAAVGSQAGAREHRIDATLAGPAWGALPGLLVPVPVPGQAILCLIGAGLVARITRGSSGLSSVLTRGVAVAGAVVALAALGLFLGPGLTPTTATAFLHAALGGAVAQARQIHLLVGAGLIAAGGLLGLHQWRGLALSRTGLATEEQTPGAVAALASAGAVLVAGVVAGLGLIATQLARLLVGEDPRLLIPAGAAAGAAIGLTLDGLAQAIAWPGELPLGVLTMLIASLLLALEVVPADQG